MNEWLNKIRISADALKRAADIEGSALKATECAWLTPH